MITLNVVTDVLVPFVIGILIPLVTAWVESAHLPTQLETFLNIALSALAAALPTTVFGGSWREYLLALALTWIGTMRGHYTGLPTKLWDRNPYGRHAAVDQPSPLD